jgi:hypothetical protein
MSDVKTIVNHYMDSLTNSQVQNELRDILYNHFETVKNSNSNVDQEYFEIELNLAKQSGKKWSRYYKVLY